MKQSPYKILTVFAAAGVIVDMTGTTEIKSDEPLQNDSEASANIQGDVSDGGKRKQGTFWKSFQRFIWDDPDKPAYERKFLLKLDIFLLSYTCLGYFCKNL